MLSTSVVIVLRLIHILVGIMWAGAIVFVAAFLMPTMKAVGPAAGPVMGHLTQVKKLPSYMVAGMLLTILSGITLFWNDSVGFKSDAWMHSGPGLAFSVGGTLAIVVAIIGLTVNSPTAKKIGTLSAAIRASGGAAPPELAAEMQRCQNRLAAAMKVAAVLLLLAASMMAVARYLPAALL
ncbi:MAG: hypothetical protein ABI625_16710 [bacterium]